jgi:glycosyltransferase involved in cell wall biosynthesis
VKTTVIVPVYNRPDALRLAIRSLLERAGQVDLDILIVDDGSTDQTTSVTADLVQSITNVRVVPRENGGVAAARNTGLLNLLPETQIVTFLDSDDIIAANRFGPDLAVLRDNPDIEITYGDMVGTDQINPETLCPAENAIARRMTSIHLSCALMRRSLVDRIGLFDTDLKQAEDTDYLLRIFESGTKFAQTDTICHYYLRHPGNMTKKLDEAKKSFALALMKSIQRRKSDPSRQLKKPSFNIDFPAELL